MSKVIDGFLLGTSGKVGAVVVVNLHGQQIIRARPKAATKPRSPKQKLTTQRFQIATQFIQSYKHFAKQFFGVQKGFKSCYNQAIGNVLQALHCNMQELTITMQYPNLQFAKGKALMPIPGAISNSQAHTIKITWANNAETPNEANDKLLVLIAADGKLTQSTYFVVTQTARQMQEHQLQIPNNLYNQKIHVWIGFINPENTQTSNSVYVGNLQVE